MLLEKTLWRIFLFILISSLVSAMLVLFHQWKDIKRETFDQLESTNRTISNSAIAVLELQESLLRIVGLRLVELHRQNEFAKANDLINQTLQQNPFLAGFGLSDLDGNLFITSGNLEQSQLPNLLKKAETRDSFQKALESDVMVLGRTYFMESAGRWLMPARFRLIDESQQTVGVMATGFTIDSAKSLWNREQLPLGMNLIVGRKYGDNYFRQYTSSPRSDGPELAAMYNNPINRDLVDAVSNALNEKYGLRLQDIADDKRIYTATTTDNNDQQHLFSLLYQPKYDLYTFVSLPRTSLYSQITNTLVWLVTLVTSFNLVLLILFRHIEKLQEKTRKSLEFQANHDALTNLPNRNYLGQKSRTWQHTAPGTQSLLAFLDLDNFKVINDFYGHRIGDEILIRVAERLKHFFDDDDVIRLGGDEFIILINGSFLTETIARMHDFLNQLNQSMQVQGIDFNINGSIGISRFPEHGDNIDELMRKADIAMYEAKRTNVDVVVFSEELDARQKKQALIEQALSGALTRNEFHLVYQPQIDVTTGRVRGIEALLRWHSDELGIISPDLFIPVAETTGQINGLGRFVFQQCLNEMCSLREHLLKHDLLASFSDETLRVAINISVQQLLHDDFRELMRSVSGEYHAHQIALLLEVTESLFIDDLDKARSILLAVTEMGVGISLDDFGTGYSSLSLLHQLPISELKIDRSFIQDIDSNPKALALAKSIIGIGQSLSIPIVAEGIETNRQSQLIVENGCDILQGYLFAKPMSLDQLQQVVSLYPAATFPA